MFSDMEDDNSKLTFCLVIIIKHMLYISVIILLLFVCFLLSSS